MKIKRFGRIFWTFFWRFVLAFCVLTFVGFVISDLLLYQPDNYIEGDPESLERIMNYNIWLGLIKDTLVGCLVFAISAAYGLYAVFKAKYLKFSISVEDTSQADEF
ncbi:MAG: hypothetical protein CMK07_03220 [Ponticaulis sp.]|nr:hypothetical protein [Ponticaulis sp.]